MASGKRVKASELTLELERICVEGWARDWGDHSASIHAIAVPVTDASERVVAALSVPFIAGADDARVNEIRAAALEAGAQLSARLKEI
jgi:DNA-binding IclR family transcriptional regulator